MFRNQQVAIHNNSAVLPMVRRIGRRLWLWWRAIGNAVKRTVWCGTSLLQHRIDSRSWTDSIWCGTDSRWLLFKLEYCISLKLCSLLLTKGINSRRWFRMLPPQYPIVGSWAPMATAWAPAKALPATTFPTPTWAACSIQHDDWIRVSWW